MKLIVGLHAILTAALVFGCGKDEDSGGGEGATEETGGVNGGEQPGGSDDGGGSDGGTTTPPVCGTDERLDGATCVTLGLTEMTSRADCHKHAGYWYDKGDVAVTTEAEYDALKPSCHVSNKDACPTSGTIPVGKYDNNSMLHQMLVTTQHVYASVNKVFTTFRCFGGDDLEVFFQYSDMKEFDAGLNPDIKYLYLDESDQLERIYFRPSMPKLEELSINRTKVPASDFTGLTGLKGLDVGNVALTSLDVSKLVNLEWLYVPYTGLTSLDLSKNDKLLGLDVSGTTIPIASLNLGRYSNFYTFVARSRNLTSFAGIPVEKLYSLAIDGANMPTIDLRAATHLQWFTCASCNANSIDLSASPDIYLLFVPGNHLTSIDVSPLYALDYLDVSENDLTSLDVAFNPELTHLAASGNALTALDVTNNLKLRHVDVRSNDLTYDGMTTKWNLAANAELDSVYVTGNPNLVLNFEVGVTVNAYLLDPNNYASIYTESARWAAYNGPHKPMSWTHHGDDPDGYYAAP